MHQTYQRVGHFKLSLRRDPFQEGADVMSTLDEDNRGKNHGWTNTEHSRFVEAVRVYGKNWQKI